MTTGHPFQPSGNIALSATTTPVGTRNTAKIAPILAQSYFPRDGVPVLEIVIESQEGSPNGDHASMVPHGLLVVRDQLWIGFLRQLPKPDVASFLKRGVVGGLNSELTPTSPALPDVLRKKRWPDRYKEEVVDQRRSAHLYNAYFTAVRTDLRHMTQLSFLPSATVYQHGPTPRGPIVRTRSHLENLLPVMDMSLDESLGEACDELVVSDF